MPKIQRVELLAHYGAEIHCPFCGKKVVASDDDESPSGFDACPHTLFFAHDEGFEYRSARFDQAAGIAGIEDDDLDPEKGIDGLTDSVEIDDAVKFAAYVGPPSFFGTYVGFAPLSE